MRKVTLKSPKKAKIALAHGMNVIVNISDWYYNDMGLTLKSLKLINN